VIAMARVCPTARVSAVARVFRFVAALTLAALVSACGSGPDPDEARTEIQGLLDSALGGRVLEFRSFVPAGGLPLKDADGRLLYFNAELELERDYDFTEWDSHSVASLAALLGAGPKGIFGLKVDGNQAGDRLGVYGSAAFVRDGSDWQLVARVPTEAASPPRTEPAATVAAVQPRPKEVLPPSPVEVTLAQLAEVLRQPPGPSLSAARRDEIVLEEADRALQAVRQRMSRAATGLTLAAGPAGGAYEETAGALAARAGAANLAFRVLSSEGSLGNVRLLRDRGVQFALVQNDLARSAVAGHGRFAGAPQTGLRAVASLFPEAVHLIARPQSGIASVADLRGKRVNLGPEGSGTRANATAILEAHRIEVAALTEAGARQVPDAAAALAAGEIDALFATIHPPASMLQRLAASTRVELVPIGPSPGLVETGLVPLTLPARSYAGQSTPVPTLAATALMVTRDDVSDAHVDEMLGLLFDQRGGASTAAVSRIAVRTARVGVTIPWHPRADANLAGRGVPAAE